MKSAYVAISPVMLVLFAAAPVFAQRAEAPSPQGVRTLNPSPSLSGAALQAQQRAAAAALDKADAELPNPNTADVNRAPAAIRGYVPLRPE